MSSYEYRPVHHQEHAFRLVQLRAGTGIDIECELVHASLDEDNLIPYEALSYTWGPPQQNDIKVDGRKMAVTVNLYAALYHLRQPERDRILWADAICINQANDTEKTHQVQQMRTIYSKAEQVVIYLGPLDDNASLLMRSLASFEKLVRGLKLNKANQEKWQHAWANVEKQTMAWHKDVRDSHRAGLEFLLSKHWFRRGWIIQEVANARRATVQCDRRLVSSKVFAISASLLEFQVDSHTHSILELMAGPRDRPAWWSEKRDLRTLLHKFSRAETTIGRDRLFSLLGICHAEGEVVNRHGVVRADYDAPEVAIVRIATASLFDCPEELLCETIFESIEQLLLDFAASGRLLLHRQVRRGGATPLRRFLEENKSIKTTENTIMVALRRTNDKLQQLSETAAGWPPASEARDNGAKHELQLILANETDMITTILQYRSEDFEISESALVEMMGSTKGRFEDGDLWQYADHLSTLGERDVLKVILDCTPDRLEITDRVIIAAGDQDREIQKRLFYSARNTVTERVFSNSTRNIEAELFIDLVNRGLLKITEEAISAACRYKPDVAKYFLERGASEISQQALVAAAYQSDTEIVALIMSSGVAKVTEEVLVAACQKSTAEMVTHLLGLGQRNDNLVTDSVVVAAVRRGFQAASTISPLLPYIPKNFILSDDILTAIAINKITGLSVLELLLQRGALCCKVSKRVVNAALSQIDDSFSEGTEYEVLSAGTAGITRSGSMDKPALNPGDHVLSVLGAILKSPHGSTEVVPFTTQALFEAVIDKDHGPALLSLFLGCVFDRPDCPRCDRHEVARVALVAIGYQHESRAQMIQAALGFATGYVTLSEVFPDSPERWQHICDRLRQKLDITSEVEQDLIDAIGKQSNLEVLSWALLGPLKRRHS